MKTELTDMVEHSATFRNYLGIASTNVLNIGDIFHRSSPFKKQASAPLVLAIVATLNIKESRVERALGELEKLLDLPEFLYSEAARDAVVLIAKSLPGNDFSSPLVERKAAIIQKNLGAIFDQDKSKVLQICATIPATSAGESAKLREQGQEFVKKEQSVRAASIDRSGRRRVMDSPSQHLEGLSTSSKLIIGEAKRRGIEVRILDPRRGKFTLRRAGITYICTGVITGLLTPEIEALCEDKKKTTEFLKSKGTAVPRQHVFQGDFQAALEFMHECQSVVVKPSRGDGGDGISVKVSTEEDLKSAIEYANAEVKKKARKSSTGEGGTVLIEEFKSGNDLRLLVINYQLAAAAIRKPAEVTGHDGLTVGELIKEYSDKRAELTSGESRIPLDEETERCLKNQQLKYDDVLEQGRTIRVRENANVHTGGTIEDVTEKLHPALKIAAETIAKEMQIPVVGLDFIVNSPGNGEYVVIEANESPGLGNHDPQPVAQRFIDMLFPFTADAVL
jgi:D-alanine-D-alanine ligase-like ATP-grasp enzyme